MNKYLIGLLIVILVIIYFMIMNKNEQFDNLLKQNNIFTNILNDKYTIIGGDNNKVLLISFPTRATPVNVYTIYNDIQQQNYYYIYNNDKIMTYVNGELYFNQANVDTVTSPNYSAYNKLYKTTDNKLYFLINNSMMYLTASKKNYAIELQVTTDTNAALIWEL
jgi:hypothetical protein